MLTHDRLEDPTLASAAGAVATFRGVVRPDGEGPRVVSIWYEAYAPLAERVANDIVSEAREMFGVDAVSIRHRLGEVPVGEASLLVVVESRHRAAAFAALPWVVDEIKGRLPVWKKECYDDGSSRWI